MTSTRETALQALFAALATISGPSVQRNTMVPVSVPAGGLLIVRDGEPGDPDITLSVVSYSYEHEAVVEAIVQHADAAARDAALDNLLGALPVALNDTTLGGAVDYVEVRAPVVIAGEEVTGAPDLKGAVVPLVLYYTTSHPLQ